MSGTDLKQYVISVQPRWAELIRSGRKTIELRRRFPRLAAGSLAYLYESSPTRALTALLHLGPVHELPVAELWRVHGEASCVDEGHFAHYFTGRDVGYGIRIDRCVLLPSDLPLAALRREFAFTAPQSWAYATPQLISAVGSGP